MLHFSEHSINVFICFYRTKSEKLSQEFPFARNWEHELGDWWDSTPITPGMSGLYDATDLLLRIRALTVFIPFFF